MMRTLLWRGMLAGLIGAIVATLFATIVAEPRVDAAIALEAHHASHHAAMAEPELVDRTTQRTWGLLTAMALYGIALGGIFAILLAGLYGRVGRIGPRGLALLIGAVGFVVIVLAPGLQYPAMPPSAGLPETLRMRTAAYFVMLAISVLAAGGAVLFCQTRLRHIATLDRALLAFGLYGMAIVLAHLALPSFDEVPLTFPASLLWQFRVASLGMQAVFWLVTAETFGRIAEPLFLSRSSVR